MFFFLCCFGSISYPKRCLAVPAKSNTFSAKLRTVRRRYRNRRIGEFFKELDLTEWRSTGIPTILCAIKQNGASQPEFETDEDRNYFLVRFPVHPKSVRQKEPTGFQKEFIENIKAHDEAHDVSDTEWQILLACTKRQQSTRT